MINDANTFSGFAQVFFSHSKGGRVELSETISTCNLIQFDLFLGLKRFFIAFDLEYSIKKLRSSAL